MLTNSIKFSHLLLPYTGEHKVGHWPGFMYNTRLDWKKRRPIGLSLNLSCDFYFFHLFFLGKFFFLWLQRDPNTVASFTALFFTSASL